MIYRTRIAKCLLLGCLILFISGFEISTFGQLREPNVEKIDAPDTPAKHGYENRIGGSVHLNNFGVAVSGLYAHSLSTYTELTFSVGVTGIRDATEQSFTNYFSGQRVVPNKYNRALGFPLMAGIKQRIFPKQVADNFRFYVAASGGPAMAFIYPYIEDTDGNGYRTAQLRNTIFGTQQVYLEKKNDIFGGLGNGSTLFGAAGEVKVGVDLGKSFKHQFTIELGYFFYYFSQGIQIMDPYRPTGYDDNNVTTGQDPFFDDQSFFGTPQITFKYSSWW